MLRTRVMPALLVADGSLVKSVQFKNHRYVGDPVNAVRIFNELEVDELVVLDIEATAKDRSPDFGLIQQISEECFMPFSYGGGISTSEIAVRLVGMGVEKLIVNSATVHQPELIRDLASKLGSQSVVVSIDVSRTRLRGYKVFDHVTHSPTGLTPTVHASHMVELGAGEILLTSKDRDGTWEGYDLELIQDVARAVDVPVIASGGAGELEDLRAAANAGASGLALGSMAVYQKRDLGVLVNFPSRQVLETSLSGVQAGTYG